VLATVDSERRAQLGRWVGIVVCDGKEVDEACEQRGCVGLNGGDDTRSSAQAHARGGCCSIVWCPWRDVRKEITRCVGGTWSVQYTCVIDFDDLWQQADGVDGFQV
jgi:hypothetical protein